MTPEELALVDQLQEGRDRWMLEADRLAAEVRRLQSVIKEAEWAFDDSSDDDACFFICPWCWQPSKEFIDAEGVSRGGSHIGCPAFLPDGTVR